MGELDRLDYLIHKYTEIRDENFSFNDSLTDELIDLLIEDRKKLLNTLHDLVLKYKK